MRHLKNTALADASVDHSLSQRKSPKTIITLLVHRMVQASVVQL